MAENDIVTRIKIPNLEAAPSDAQMAAKYFLDIMNDGSPEMIDGVREILKAIWMRLALKDKMYDPERRSDEDLSEAINNWYRRMHKIEFGTEKIDG